MKRISPEHMSTRVDESEVDISRATCTPCTTGYSEEDVQCEVSEVEHFVGQPHGQRAVDDDMKSGVHV